MIDTVPGPRPQPVGALAWPAGLLLLPDLPGADAAAADLVRGATPAQWPAGLEFFAAALDGDDPAEAAALLGDGDDDIVAAYNRAVLIGGDERWEDLAARTTGTMRALVDVGRYTVGLIDEPPSAEDVTADRGEVAAIVFSARASAAIERGERDAAVDELAEGARRAAEAGSPALAASLYLTRAEFLRDHVGDSRAAALAADQGMAALPMTADPEVRAGLHLLRGLSRQDVAPVERGALLAVVADLTEATKVFREDSHPETFALCNNQLALAYLMMPMSDQGDRIRLGVAVNSLRAALKVYRPDTHPGEWARTQVNLANALQYLPSAHQQENLDEAVQLYEEVLQRVGTADPLSRARLLANQGNALGHLGVFADARERLAEARELFAANGDPDSAASVAQTLGELAQAEAAAAGGPTKDGA